MGSCIYAQMLWHVTTLSFLLITSATATFFPVWTLHVRIDHVAYHDIVTGPTDLQVAMA